MRQGLKIKPNKINILLIGTVCAMLVVLCDSFIVLVYPV
jgi:hypothetical protein